MRIVQGGFYLNGVGGIVGPMEPHNGTDDTTLIGCVRGPNFTDPDGNERSAAPRYRFSADGRYTGWGSDTIGWFGTAHLVSPFVPPIEAGFSYRLSTGVVIKLISRVCPWNDAWTLAAADQAGDEFAFGSHLDHFLASSRYHTNGGAPGGNGTYGRGYIEALVLDDGVEVPTPSRWNEYAGAPSPEAMPPSSEIVASPSPVSKNPTVTAFVAASPTEQKSLIRLGFEVETQASNGWTWESQDEATDRWTFCEIECKSALLTKNRWMEFLTFGAFKEISLNHHLCTPQNKDAWYKRFKEQAIRTIINIASRNPGENYPGWTENEDYIAVPDIEGLERGQDSSVNGFEFRTTGPRTYAQCVGYARDFFEHTHEIDSDCSFHVHVSLPNVRHKYDETHQSRLVGAVLSSLDRVPTTVLERWTSSALGQWFKLCIDDDKYNFIAYRREHGTWEFRCWGNVQKRADAVRCLDLTVEAFAKAYSDAEIDPWDANSALDKIRAELNRRQIAETAEVEVETALAA